MRLNGIRQRKWDAALERAHKSHAQIEWHYMAADREDYLLAEAFITTDGGRYEVTIDKRGHVVEGDCTCDGAYFGGLCKHVALVVSELGLLKEAHAKTRSHEATKRAAQILSGRDGAR